MKKSFSVDVVIIGAGVAGLMLAKKLVDLGLQVAVIEKESTVANGASSQNEGWLHRGTYHAASIQERSSAIQVARRCIYGYEQIKGYAPEAIYDTWSHAYALLRESRRVKEIMDRWNEANVLYKIVRKSDIQMHEPLVNVKKVAKVFRVSDLSIHTGILYRKLLADIQNRHILIFTETTAKYRNEKEVSIISRGKPSRILRAEVFVYTAGYSMKDIFKEQFGVEIPLRYWKSHLLIIPRCMHHNVFFLDAHEAAMVHHNDWTIIGMNEDAERCEAADITLVPSKIHDLEQSAKRMIREIEFGTCRPLACIKVDVNPFAYSPRSLNVAYDEPLVNHFWLLPGKMTESPFATDYMVQIVCQKIEDKRIASRPCDKKM